MVSSVKNQWACGSCWSFATAAQIESYAALAGADLVDLSTEQVSYLTNMSTTGHLHLELFWVYQLTMLNFFKLLIDYICVPHLPNCHILMACRTCHPWETQIRAAAKKNFFRSQRAPPTPCSAEEEEVVWVLLSS